MQSLLKAVGTLELYHVSPIPHNAGRNVKQEKSPYYQHCKWVGERTCFVLQFLLSGIVVR